MTTTTIPAKAIATDTISLAEYNAIANDINELIGRSGRNLLVNGGFERWTLGAGPFTADLAYTADLWQLDLVGASTCTVTQETSLVSSGLAALKAVYVQSSNSFLQQKLEDYAAFRGKTLSLTMMVRCTVAKTINLVINDGVGSTQAGVAVAANTYTRISVTRAIDAAATQIVVALVLDASATYYVDDAMLVLGPSPTEFVPLAAQEDIARCQRYIEFIGGVAGSIYQRGYNTTGNQIGTTLAFKVPKPAAPTVTKVGTWTVGNCAQPTIDAPSTTTCRMYSSVTATGDAFFTTSNATDGILVTSYP